MPAAIEYVPPTDIERNDFAIEVERERSVRRDAYRSAITYYNGDHPDQLTVEDDMPDDNVIINLVRMTADRTVTFLFPNVPEFEIDPDTVEPTEEEAFLKRFFEDNGGLATFVKLALRGFLAGHSYVRIKPAVEGTRSEVLPRMVVLDPNYVNVYWRADDVADVLWYEMRYMVGDRIRVQDFVHQPSKRNWRIYTYEGRKSHKPRIFEIPTRHGDPISNELFLDKLEFKESQFELINTAIHNSPLPPIVDFAHLPNPDDYFGLSETNQKDLQDTINRIASEMNRIVRENADPVDVLTGADIDDIQDSGGIITVATIGAKIQRLEMKGDLSGIRDTLEKLIETYLAVSRVVLLKGEAKDLQRVTNASVRTLFLDALSKNEILRSTYGSGLITVAKVALMMGYQAGHIAANPKEINIEVKFSEPLPTDMFEVANINAIQVNMGARSLRTAATKIGDKWAFEQDAMKAEHEVAMEHQEEQLTMQKSFASEDESNSPIDNG